MSEESVVRNCAPALAGMKTGNMFRCAYASEQEISLFIISETVGFDTPSVDANVTP